MLLLLVAAGTLHAQSPRAMLADKMRATLAEIARESPGVVGAQVIDLTSGERIGVNDTLSLPTGSSIKVALLVEMFREAEAGTLSLDSRLKVNAATRTGGSSVAQYFSDGTSELSLHDLAVLMVVLSDNTATNLLIDRVGTDKVNATMRELGLSAVRWQRRMIDPKSSWEGRENLATAAAAASLMARIAKCDLPMSKERCAAMRGILEIPKPGTLPASVPPSIKVAWKPGTLEGVSSAWGIVDLPGRPYVVAAMVTYGDDNADAVVRRVADAAYAYFTKVARASSYGVRVPLGIVKP